MPEILDIAQTINGSHRVVLVALEQYRIIGTADIAWTDYEEPALCNVFVLGTARGQGVGAALVGAAMSWAKANETRLWLNVRPGRLASWYARLGFRETGETSGEYLWMEWNPAQAERIQSRGLSSETPS